MMTRAAVHPCPFWQDSWADGASLGPRPPAACAQLAVPPARRMGGIISRGGTKISAVAEEAGAKVGGASAPEDSVVLKLSENQLEEFRECFNAFDKDGGGSIDSQELEALMKSLGQEPTAVELQKMVDLADADGSGDIDFIEFVTLIAHKMKDDDSSMKESRLKAAFQVFVRTRRGNRTARVRHFALSLEAGVRV